MATVGDTMPYLNAKQHFQAWATTPNRKQPSAGGGSKDLEDALWEAYQEGYKQCKRNVEAAIANIAA
jgi:hypothetical protein